MSNAPRILLNVGCGHQRPPGWINTDCSLNALMQRVPLLGSWLARTTKATAYSSHDVTHLNLNHRWPYAEGTLDVVYGSHVFEHLSMSKARHFLDQAMRVLRPGGIIRLVVPDLYHAAKDYAAGFETGDPGAAEHFLALLNLHREGAYAPTRGLLYRLTHWAQDWPHQHKYMYDASNLRALMAEHGIRDIVQSRYAESTLIPEIAEVENTAEGIQAIYLEGVKPL